MRISRILSVVCISLALHSLPAMAQSYASGCLQACRIVSNAFPLDAVQPVGCKLFYRDSLTQTALVVAAGGGAVACSFPVTLAPGPYSFSASALGPDGSESARSAALEFVLDASGVITLQAVPKTDFSPHPSR